jgi:transcriptional regulator GlxA family with amidase domain
MSVPEKLSPWIFGCLAFSGVEELDLMGPWELAGMWGMYAGGPEQRLIVAEGEDPIVCAKGLRLVPHVSFENCPPLDVLLVPGGQGTRREVDNQKLIDFISRQARSCRAVLSVCTGSFLLERAGILSGKKATTHWASLDRLRALGGVTVVEDRFTRDGAVWTAAGVSAGMDLMLAFIASLAGDQAAGTVQLAAEYYPAGALYGNGHLTPQAPAYIRSLGAATSTPGFQPDI